MNRTNKVDREFTSGERAVLRGYRRGNIGRRMAWSSGAATAVLAAVMFLAPAVAGHTVLTITAPYTGVTPITSKSLSTSGCHSNAAFPTRPVADTTTGAMRFGLTASVKGCGISSYTYADSYATTEFYGPSFSLGSAGHATFTTDWSLSLNAHLFVNNNSNSSVFDGAYVIVYVYAYVVDETNFTYYYNNTTSFMTVLYKTIPGGHWSTDLDSMTQSVVMSGTLVSGHQYDFVTYAAGYAAAFLYPGITGGAAASLDLGANGNGLTVTSFSVS